MIVIIEELKGNWQERRKEQDTFLKPSLSESDTYNCTPLPQVSELQFS